MQIGRLNDNEDSDNPESLSSFETDLIQKLTGVLLHKTPVKPSFPRPLLDLSSAIGPARPKRAKAEPSFEQPFRLDKPKLKEVKKSASRPKANGDQQLKKERSISTGFKNSKVPASTREQGSYLKISFLKKQIESRKQFESGRKKQEGKKCESKGGLLINGLSAKRSKLSLGDARVGSRHGRGEEDPLSTKAGRQICRTLTGGLMPRPVRWR